MNPLGWDEEVQNAKAAAISHFRETGFRVFAFVDNEPANVNAVAKIDPNREILLLHANTLFESKQTSLPSRAVGGTKYDLTDLIPERALPRHVQFVWHGINDDANVCQFLASDVTWGECDVRMDPIGSRVILRHDSFAQSPLRADEEWLSLDALFRRLVNTEKRIKIDLKSGEVLLIRVLDLVHTHGFDDSRLWFNGNVERLHEEGFRRVASAHPKAILQCPVDFLAPLVVSAPEKAKEILDMFTAWGVNRFSVGWQAENTRPFFDRMDDWGYEVNIYGVTDLESFLKAVLLEPRSITSDFNFPKWHYYGRGSGQGSEYYEYAMYKTSGPETP